jgi:hypothetical protein
MLNGHQSAYLVNYFVSRLPRAMNDGMCWRDAATVLFVASKKKGDGRCSVVGVGVGWGCSCCLLVALVVFTWLLCGSPHWAAADRF